MAYNKARAEKQWLKWKEAEERKLRELGVDEDTIQRLHTYDWAQFNTVKEISPFPIRICWAIKKERTESRRLCRKKQNISK